ncbi:MAG TPA: hypothetical protein VK004_00055 [Ignavibacteria bacterium]|nr:hypothetical protein [Ignavibacteria bacterium]
MSFLLRKYKQAFRVFSITMITVFALSSVSVAYTSVFCKMKKAEMEETENCCCKAEESRVTEVSCCEIPEGEPAFSQAHGYCCEIKEANGTEKNYVLAVSANTTVNTSHEGSLLFELPTPNNIPALQGISPAGKIISDGRSVLTFNSVLRI